jgi:hypothetical protein
VGYTTRIKIVVSSSEKLDKKNKKTLTGIAINNHKLERIRSTTDKYYNKNKYQKFFAKRLEDINLLAEISPDTYDLYNEFRNDKFIWNAF